jgi:Ni,Fe-hydrogenase III small subunit
MSLVSMKLTRAQATRANLASREGRIPIARWEEAKFAVSLGAIAFPACAFTRDIAHEQPQTASPDHHVVAVSLWVPTCSAQRNRCRRNGLERIRLVKREHIAYAQNVRRRRQPTNQRNRR